MMFLHHPSRKFLAYLPFILIGLIGALVIAYSTSWGAIVYSDSTAYILSARNLLAGKGLGIPQPGGSFQLLTHYPPLYPLVLCISGLVGIDPLVGARWLNILLFGLVIILVSASVYHFSHRFIFSFLTGIAILTSPLFLDIFSRAMSESLFFLLALSSLFLFVEYMGFPRRWIIASAGITTGLACLTRYIGFTLLFCGAFLLFVVPKCDWKNRLKNLGLFIGLSGGLSASWLVPLFLSTHQFAARSFQVGDDLPIALSEAKVALIDLGWSWLPFSHYLTPRPSYFVRGWLMIILLVLLGAITWFIAWKRLHNQKNLTDMGYLYLAGVFTLFAGSYLVFLILSFFFSFPRNDLDSRLLSPIYLSLLLFIFPLLTWDLLGMKTSRYLVWIPVFGLVLVITGGFAEGLDFVQTNHQHGAGYTSAAWTDSPAIRAVEELDTGEALVSNESAAILFLTGRPAYDVNEIYRTSPSDASLRYGDDPEDPAQRLFKAGKAKLVIFPTTFYWQMFPNYGENTQARLDILLGGLQVEQRLVDGVIYSYSQP